MSDKHQVTPRSTALGLFLIPDGSSPRCPEARMPTLLLSRTRFLICKLSWCQIQVSPAPLRGLRMDGSLQEGVLDLCLRLSLNGQVFLFVWLLCFSTVRNRHRGTERTGDSSRLPQGLPWSVAAFSSPCGSSPKSARPGHGSPWGWEVNNRRCSYTNVSSSNSEIRQEKAKEQKLPCPQGSSKAPTQEVGQ